MTGPIRKRTERQWSEQQGFSILEVPVALFVIVIGLLGLHLVTLMVVDSVDVGERITMAISLARDKTEEIKAMDYLDVTADQLPGEDYGTITGAEEYSRTVSIQIGTPETNSKTITVTVSWFDAVAQSARSVSVSTILAGD